MIYYSSHHEMTYLAPLVFALCTFHHIIASSVTAHCEDSWLRLLTELQVSEPAPALTVKQPSRPPHWANNPKLQN